MEFLYKDEHILAVNKPAGLLSIPDGYHKELPNLKQLLESEFSKVWTVHRLDKETSGVVLFALNAAAHRSLSIQFEKRVIDKTYLVLVTGVLPYSTFTINIPLKVNGDRRHRTIPDAFKGKPAQTDVSLIKAFRFFSLVKAYPKTGYLHQIRAHLKHAGYPVVNDILYGFTSLPPECNFAAKRLMLHALSISFTHPVRNETMLVESPSPVEFFI